MASLITTKIFLDQCRRIASLEFCSGLLKDRHVVEDLKSSFDGPDEGFSVE